MGSNSGNNSASTTRQRPNAKKNKKKADDNKNTKKKNATATAAVTPNTGAAVEDGEQTLWQTFTSHWSLPFYGITIAVMAPYFIYTYYLYLRLERPDLVAQYTAGLVRWRPAVTLTTARPVLIVGTISGATTQVAHDLQYLMDLELCHENSETTRHFCRDGTVSWFHGLRFLNRTTDTVQHYQSLAQLCTNFTPSMGFHPRMFRDTSNCSIRTKQWGKCWARECLDLVHHEWGCAWNNKDNNNNNEDAQEMDTTTLDNINPGKPCQTPFGVALHQARHPLRTVESLVSKFCPKKNQPMDAGFVQMVQALFPRHDFESYSCLQAASHYVLEYHTAMRHAVQAGLIQQTYLVEETTPCQVASMAGLDGFGGNNPSVVWQGSKEAVTRACEDPKGQGHEPMTSTEYKVNYGKVALTQDNFSTDSALWNKLVNLAVDLGYQDMDSSQQRSHGHATAM